MTTFLNRTWINQMLDVPSLDAEDGRRRKLLNILLLGIAALTALTLILTVLSLLAGTPNDPGTSLLFQALIITLIGMALIYVVNRYWSGSVAAVAYVSVFPVKSSITACRICPAGIL